MNTKDTYFFRTVLSFVVLSGFAWVAQSSADQLLSLEDAAKRIGEVVTFESEVIAVPQSPRRMATYVNFGNAYPWQTLSLLFAEDDVNILTNFPHLRGKTVRVTGFVDSTKTGPVIQITNASQIQVIMKIESAALDEEGEGHGFRKRIGVTLRSLLNSRDYKALEKVSAEWGSGRARFLDGHWKIQTFYESFGLSNYRKEGDRDAFIASLEEWKLAYPQSLAPYIIKADYLADYAWTKRGSGYAYTVSSEMWNSFSEQLALARAELDAVYDRRLTCPQWYLVMQTIALGQGWSRKEYDALFDEAMENEPEYHFYCVKKARYLQEKWFGNPGEWEAFAKSLVTRYPDGLGEILYTFVVWNMRAEEESILMEDNKRYFTDTDVEWPLCKSGFERLHVKYPKSLWILNNFALFAGKADDRDTLHNLMIELGNNCDMAVWVTWENVALVRMWAARKEPPGVTVSLFR